MEKPRFNIVDFLIIVLIIAVGFLGFYILGSKSGTVATAEKTTVLVTIEEDDIDENMRDMYLENAKVGAKVKMGIREKVEGTLEQVNVLPETEEYTNPITGVKEAVPKIGRYDMTFTIKAELSESDRDFLIGTAKIKIGKELNFVGKGFSGYGNVVVIEKVGGEENDK